MTRHIKTRKGFSLAEAMIATVVLGIAAAGVLLPFTSGASVRAEGYRRTLASKLAGDLVEQIIQSPVEEIIANYNYSEPQGDVKDVLGVVFSDLIYSKFSRDVSSGYFDVSAQEIVPTETDFILVSVRVYYEGGEMAVVNRLISR
jgi:prepilin-type N-terminal cleavage/methylation domain-containing protein